MEDKQYYKYLIISRRVSFEKANKLMKEMNINYFKETSAKNGSNTKNLRFTINLGFH